MVIASRHCVASGESRVFERSYDVTAHDCDVALRCGVLSFDYRDLTLLRSVMTSVDRHLNARECDLTVDDRDVNGYVAVAASAVLRRPSVDTQNRPLMDT
jgi:hypothetical protein